MVAPSVNPQARSRWWISVVGMGATFALGLGVMRLCDKQPTGQFPTQDKNSIFQHTPTAAIAGTNTPNTLQIGNELTHMEQAIDQQQTALQQLRAAVLVTSKPTSDTEDSRSSLQRALTNVQETHRELSKTSAHQQAVHRQLLADIQTCTKSLQFVLQEIDETKNLDDPATSELKRRAQNNDYQAAAALGTNQFGHLSVMVDRVRHPLQQVGDQIEQIAKGLKELAVEQRMLDNTIADQKEHVDFLRTASYALHTGSYRFNDTGARIIETLNALDVQRALLATSVKHQRALLSPATLLTNHNQ